MTGHWAALLPATEAQAGLHPVGAHELGLGMLAFSPRVAVFEEAVLIEAQASLRLFGGAAALHRQVADLATALGVCDLGWAPTGLAALAKARARALHRQGATRIRGLAASADAVGLDGEQPDLEGVAIPWLDRLPLQVLSAVARHRPTLARLGCQTLGDVRRLPRAGLARRFDAELLDALDQAYGLQPESHVWLSLPDVFEARLELLARVEQAEALMAGAERLLLQLRGWLTARQAGADTLTLRWLHDSFRARDCGPGGELTVRSAQPSQDVRHLGRLLAERLAPVTLEAPVSDLVLQVERTQPLVLDNASLLPERSAQAESCAQTLERIAARLGAEAIERPVLVADHRLEWMQQWQPPADPRAAPGTPPLAWPLPCWQLAQPLRLAMQGELPLYQGPLQLLLGPDRIESGWWGCGDAAGTPGQPQGVARDYWLAHSASAGLLWVFQQRLARDDTAWYLHGRFG